MKGEIKMPGLTTLMGVGLQSNMPRSSGGEGQSLTASPVPARPAAEQVPSQQVSRSQASEQPMPYYFEFQEIVENNTKVADIIDCFKVTAIRCELTKAEFSKVIQDLKADQNLKADQSLQSFMIIRTIQIFETMLAGMTANDDDHQQANKEFLDALDRNSRAFASPGPARQGGSAQASLDFSNFMAQNLDPNDERHLKEQFGAILNLLQAGEKVHFPSDKSNERKVLYTNLGLGIANRSLDDPLILSIQACIGALKSQKSFRLSFGRLTVDNAKKGIYQVWGANERNRHDPTAGSGQAAVAVEINKDGLGNTLIPINTMRWSSSSPSGLSGQASEQPVSRFQASSSSPQYFSQFKKIVDGSTTGRLKAIQDKAIDLQITREGFKAIIDHFKTDPKLMSTGFESTIDAFDKMLAITTANDDDYQQANDNDYQQANKYFLDALNQNSLIRFSDLTLQDKPSSDITTGIMENWDNAFLKLRNEPERHDFVQILFPNRKCGVHHKSFYLGEDQSVINDLIKLGFSQNLKQALPDMLSHWGFKIDNHGNVTLDKTKTQHTKSYVITKGHNQLRISRVLECLRLFKTNDPYLNQVSSSLFTQLVKLNKSNSSLSESMKHWTTSHHGKL